MNWLAVTSLREYWCSIENKQWPEWTQVCKNNTPEKAVALLGSINKELAAIQNYALTQLVPHCRLAKQRNERHIEQNVCGRITRRRHGGRSGLEKQRNGRHIYSHSIG